MKNALAVGVLLLAVAGDAAPPVPMAPHEAAERYAKLALEHGEYDADYIDACFGPPECAKSVSGNSRPKEDLPSAIRALLVDLEAVSPGDARQGRRY
jgi:hypothetical protein